MAVILRPEHRKIIAEAFVEVVEFKSRALKRTSWDNFYQYWVPSATDQITKNEFKLNHPTKNFFVWLIDQMCHSNKITPGVPPKDCMPLIDTGLGEKAAEICRQASRGQYEYDRWCRQKNYRELFQ